MNAKIHVRVGPEVRAVCAEDMESDKCHLSGIIVRDLAAKVSNYRASQSLDEYLKAQVRQQEPAMRPQGLSPCGRVHMILMRCTPWASLCRVCPAGSCELCALEPFSRPFLTGWALMVAAAGCAGRPGHRERGHARHHAAAARDGLPQRRHHHRRLQD